MLLQDFRNDEVPGSLIADSCRDRGEFELLVKPDSGLHRRAIALERPVADMPLPGPGRWEESVLHSDGDAWIY